MGEYAIRKKDRAEIKIGSCESMYYCRYEQLGEIEYRHSTDNCLWRIPVPCEDGIEPGDFEHGLTTAEGCIYCQLRLNSDKIPDKETLTQNDGIVQVRAEALGMLINVKCLHGIALPESSDSAKFFWNGKRDPIHLSALKNTDKELLVVFECSACREAWSCKFEEIEPAIEDMEMKLRLFHQCSEYYYDHNEGYPYGYAIEAESKDGGTVTIIHTEKDEYAIYADPTMQHIYGTWEEIRNLFIDALPDDGNRHLKEKYLQPLNAEQ